MVLLISLLCSWCAGWVCLQAQAPKPKAPEPEAPVETAVSFDEVARELLKRPAPTPRLPQTEIGQTSAEREARFFDLLNPPPDTAPTADLLDYWRHAGSGGEFGRPQPTATVRERLLAISEADPRFLDELLPFLPAGRITGERVVAIYNGAESNEELSPTWYARVEKWLKLNSAYYLQDLSAESVAARDQGGRIQNERSLTTLATVDPSGAKPILTTLAETDQLRTEALATALLFRIAAEEHDDAAQTKYRTRLQSIADDRWAPAKARAAAIDGLLRVDWPGRDDWYRAKFGDRTLVGLAEGGVQFSPLAALLEQDPDRWIPILAEMTENHDLEVRSNAGNSLVQFALTNPRRDAIVPLIPWLNDRKLFRISPSTRTAFIRHLVRYDLREALPALVRIVYEEPENRYLAAAALARFKDARAVPALNWALTSERNELSQQALIGPLFECGGIPEPMQIEAVSAYARALTTDEGREKVSRPRQEIPDALPLMLAIGKYLAQRPDVPDGVAAGIMARAQKERRSDPPYAQALLEVARNWQVAPVDLDLLRRIDRGTATAAMIAVALDHRLGIRKYAAPELIELSGRRGSAPGFAAILSGVDAQVDAVLDHGDTAAKIALLASARLVQEPLPVRTVAAFLKSNDSLLAQAAEKYLLAEDSREARWQLWEHNPQSAYITGWREKLPVFRADDFATTEPLESHLQAELFGRGDVPQALYAILDQQEWPSQMLRVYRHRAVYTRNETSYRYRERIVTLNERSDFLNYVASRNLTLTGPRFSPCERDCQSFEFLAMNRSGARRIVIRTDAGDRNTVRSRLEKLAAGAKTHYRFEDTIDGVEVLIDDPEQQVKNVWQEGNDLRVRIERGPVPVKPEPTVLDTIMPPRVIADPYLRPNQLAPPAARELPRTGWYGMRDGHAIVPVARPAPIMSIDETELDLDPQIVSASVNRRIGSATANNFTLLATMQSPVGLWLKRGSSTPALVGRSNWYRDPIVSPDGVWALATRLEPYRSWIKVGNELRRAPANYLVRINVETEEETPIRLSASGEVDALAYLPAWHQFLVRVNPVAREQDTDVRPPVFYLVEPISGLVQVVTGEFEPLWNLSNRMLQRTSNANEYWAAIPDPAKPETRVGRYNLRTFTFQPVMTIPYVAFDSQAIWVDEANKKLFLVLDGQLVRMPLGPSVKAATTRN